MATDANQVNNVTINPQVLTAATHRPNTDLLLHHLRLKNAEQRALITKLQKRISDQE